MTTVETTVNDSLNTLTGIVDVFAEAIPTLFTSLIPLIVQVLIYAGIIGIIIAIVAFVVNLMKLDKYLPKNVGRRR